MRWFLILLATCVALTALKFAVIVLTLALVITILWGAFAHPAETLGTLAFFLIAHVVMNHTLASLAVIAIVAFLIAVCRRPPAGEA